ncbi:hypothetical protein N656DRAFT_846248 [Canariomyces notabilis]|uniref:Uncharacterized protein n=1 Tax=Canariomyces notabilis TaxID=2074819 RepID=A0AAN6TBX9_9PEZI|nr:hypothetical protein N656DRAFT_846248 [Canariomyces arenarius]
MTAQRQSRFSRVDQESVNTLLQAYTVSAIEEEGNEKPFVAPGTKAQRDRIWVAWTDFCELTRKKEAAIDSRSGFDSCRFWVDFAQDPSNPNVLAPIQTFLHKYVESSYKERVVLGPEERAMVRTVNSAYSVIEVWRRLVAAADFNVLHVERAALRRNGQAQKAGRLVLMWEQEGEKREGPAYSIVRWIRQTLTPTLGLEMGSSYEKVEAIAADIIVILTALYQRADDIPATPLTRVSVHHAILQLGTGGFCPGCLEDTLYKQFTISIVRDPDDPTLVKPIVTYRIDRNKIKEAEKTVKYRKNTSVAHSTTLVPFPLLDSASLVIARAIQMDALDLDVSYRSLSDLLQRPRLGETGRIDIPWKGAAHTNCAIPI